MSTILFKQCVVNFRRWMKYTVEKVINSTVDLNTTGNVRVT